MFNYTVDEKKLINEAVKEIIENERINTIKPDINDTLSLTSGIKSMFTLAL